MKRRLLVLAARNLARHRRRTILTGLIVVVGTVATTMTAGFVEQSFRGLREATIRGQGGEIRVIDARAAGKTDDEAASTYLAGWRDVAAIAREDSRVASAAPRLAFFGLAARGEKSIPFLGTGVVPELEKGTSFTGEVVAEGRFLPDAAADDAMAGTGLLRALGGRVGETVTVMTTTADGALNASDENVVARLEYPIREVDDRLLVLTFDSASRLLKAEGKASAVLLNLAPGADEEAVATSLRERFRLRGRAVAVRTWMETASFYRQVRMLYVAIFGFTGLVLATVVVLAAANTMTMSVMERTREIGTLLALGMERAQVRALFLFEGLLLGLLGSAVGTVAALVLSAGLNAARISMPPPPGGARGLVLHVDFVPGAFLAGLVLMTATLVLASWWPARRAARLDPVEALAHV